MIAFSLHSNHILILILSLFRSLKPISQPLLSLFLTGSPFRALDLLEQQEELVARIISLLSIAF
jgi:hypothetical protein